MSTTDTFLPRHGHFRQLRVYKIAEMLYDLTYYFTKTYLERGDRTIDQMVQVARSGKQNIAEGNMAAHTSAETEIKLTNVAKASLGELLLDYEDYLRVRDLTPWGKAHARAIKLRSYVKSAEFVAEYSRLKHRLNDEELANLCITLLHQVDILLARLLEHQQARFLQQGGIRERMTVARLRQRAKQ